MNAEKLRDLLQDISRAQIAVIGDYCLDVYWFINMDRSEISLETGIDTRPAQKQSYSLGGAGNVVNNLVDLGCGSLYALGVLGNDPWGMELRRLLEGRGVDATHMLVQEDDWATLAYVKPYIKEDEQNRIDFGNFNIISDETATELLNQLQDLLPDVDIVVINQQVLQGIHSKFFREGLVELIAANPDSVFIADSRHYTESYSGALLKVNDHEAARLCGFDRGREEMVLREEAVSSAQQLFERSGNPVFVTRGSRGCVVYDDSGLQEIPGIQVLSRIDTVGAGDSMLAGIAAGMAVNASPIDAATLGSFVATVTIQKLQQTGTATPEEVLEVGLDPDYIYSPELAEDPRRARILTDTEFEIVSAVPENLRITHAIFDHDGTISTLRQGWESIMEPMMVRAILGPRFESADESLYHRVVDRVRDFIDKSTGIQTIVQMQGLVELVREFGCVPQDEILDEFGYKEIYNEDLMHLVTGRVQKLERGELGVEDFTLKNAPKLLESLHTAGVKLYLASGTDEQDVIAEAEALGYAGLFEGRIYGSVGDATKEAKRIVLDRIMSSLGEGAFKGLVTFGDGPVEIRETRKKNGYAIGIASDEVRRYGPNEDKRSRLIRAGADMIIPDFSQLGRLLNVLGIHAK